MPLVLHNRLPLSVIIILRGNPVELVTLGKHGVRQRVQRQCPCTVSLRDGRRELDGTRHTVYRGDERTALQYRVYDTGIERLVGITAVLFLRLFRQRTAWVAPEPRVQPC